MPVGMRCRIKQHVVTLCLEHYFHSVLCQVVDPFVVIHIETETQGIYCKRVHFMLAPDAASCRTSDRGMQAAHASRGVAMSSKHLYRRKIDMVENMRSDIVNNCKAVLIRIGVLS